MNHLFRDFVIHRPRFVFALNLGIFGFFLLPVDWSLISRVLMAWNVTVWTYLFLVVWLLRGSSHESVVKVAEREDNSAFAVLFILACSATASLFAIVFELSNLRELNGEMRLLKYLFTSATVIGAWLLLATIFTFHYALLFYRSPKEQRALQFPNQEAHPDYWDFLYFSFTIAVALQTSDVLVMSRAMRKTVLAQSVLSFMFNAAILGFSINIAAGLVGN
nr:DUF1345 domain-containing protein [uncultured Undibacterium sp.]